MALMPPPQPTQNKKSAYTRSIALQSLMTGD